MQLDFGLIITTALLGGVFGGVGGLIGSLVGRRFPGAAKLVSTVCAIIGCVLALVVSPIVRSGLGGGGVDPELAARYDRELRNASSLFDTIAAGWPSEYREFLDALASRGSQLDQATADRLANEFTVGLRKSNAHLAGYSEDEGLRSYFRSYVDFLREVHSRDGAQLCAEIMIQGPQALGARAEQYLAQLVDSSKVVMTVLINGRNRRDSGARAAPDPSAADIGDFEAFVFERTGERGLVDRMRDSRSPDLCNTGIRVFTALGEFAPDQTGAYALRAATFRNIIAS